MIRKIYFMGIKGVGMATLAIIAKEAGIIVGGSDIGAEFITDRILKDSVIVPVVGFDKKNVEDFFQGLKHEEGLFIATGAHEGFDNPEAECAKILGYKVISHGQAVGLFMKGEIFGRTEIEGVSVSGSHGKTTITGMLATVLVSANLDPSYTIGTSIILPIGAGGHYGKGRFFVAEADEYVSEARHDRIAKFLYQEPNLLIINNIDYDHPDFYPDIESLENVYLDFAFKLGNRGTLVVNGDDEHIRKILQKLTSGVRVITYGTDSKNDFVLTKFSQDGFISTFSVTSKGTSIGDFSIQVPGYHNAKNALSVIAAGIELGVSIDKINAGLVKFAGVKRRIEYVGKTKYNQIVLDDYAHHPEEIRKTLAAVKSAYPDKKIVTVFQPHTFSRTEALMSDFVSAFSDSDELILTSTFTAQRGELGNAAKDQELASQFEKINKNFKFIEKLPNVVEYIDKNITQSNRVILTMGAGNVYGIAYKILQQNQ